MVLIRALFLLQLAAADAFSLGSVERAVHHHHCLSRTTKINRPIVTIVAKSKSHLLAGNKQKENHHMPSLALATNGDGEKKRFSFLSPKVFPNRDALGLVVWLLFISTFIVINVKGEPYPQNLLLALSRQQWSLVHAISSMMFGGTILLSTLIENLVVSSRKSAVVRFWFLSVPRLDSLVVLPALTGSIISGIGQATIDYGGMIGAPKHVTGAVHALLTFGLWWGATDITTQERAKELARSLDGESDALLQGDGDATKLLKLRRISNIVSCLMVIGLYALMVLKPGFD